MKRSFYHIIVGIISILALASCTKSCTNERQKLGPTINVALSYPIETMDPRYATSATASRVAELLYASLFEMDSNLIPRPFLAESITALDTKTFKIKLKPNLRFHDGKPLTAQDVVYTFSSLKSQDVASPHAEKFEYVESITASNDQEIIFELKRPHAPFMTDLCSGGIVSKSSCENRSQACRHEYNGSGPFILKKWDKAKETVHLEPFVHWFEGPPKVSLQLRIVRDENTRLLELIGGKTDLAEGDISPQSITELKRQKHLEVSEIPGLGYSYLGINVRGPKKSDKEGSDNYLTLKALADKRVRKAIAHAIDFDQIIEKILLNTADRVSGLIPNNHWAKDENLKPLSFDPTLAAQLLEEAGFKAQEATGMRFKLVIACTPNRIRQSIAQLYVDYLRKVGIDASVRVKDWGALYQDMQQGNFELFSAVWVPVIDPDLYHWVHHSSSIPTEQKAGGNRHGYQNPQIDHLIELGRTSMESEKRKLIYHEIERIMLEDLPYIPFLNEHRIVVQNRERIFGFKPSPMGSLSGLRKTYSQREQH